MSPYSFITIVEQPNQIRSYIFVELEISQDEFEFSKLKVLKIS